MKQGYLSQYFKAIAAKTLSAVEASTTHSNQHEFNGVAPLKRIFGREKQKFPTRFIYLRDCDDDLLTDSGFLTWYDSREKHASRTEHRMYFPTTSVSSRMSAGDQLFIGLRPDNSILAVVAETGSTIANQVRWLFGITDTELPDFSVREDLESDKDRIAFASRVILEQIGIEIEDANHIYLEDMLQRFKQKFPKARVFSAYARSTLNDLSPLDNPDEVLMSWMEREEILFRTMERYFIAQHLSAGSPFKEDYPAYKQNRKPNPGMISGVDVDEFIRYALSVINRRKSRVGHALENHVEQLLISRAISFDRTKVTEYNSKPDFIFPGIAEYHSSAFNASLLTMLGVKSTCKDRWRQVLTEAEKIPDKHLLTLEAAISESQTNEMQSHNLQLVVPSAIGNTYSEGQQRWLMSVEDFIQLVLTRQGN